MNSYIVITSINKPTPAVEAYAQLSDHKTLVVGDAKTPSDWQCAQVEFYSLKQQYDGQFSSSKLFPENHYSRKNLGYLKAIHEGAQSIIDTDDDNIPYENYKVPPFHGSYDNPGNAQLWVNVYKYFTDTFVWPRGFPLYKIKMVPPDLMKKESKVAIWQGLADKDPDVDAIYRLTSNQPITFAKRCPVVLESGTFCPINSQNTTFPKETFPLLYLPHSVSFRFTDILRGIVAQAILSKHGKCIGFHAATVYQERNPHNLMSDFESEVPCYLQTESIPQIISNALQHGEDLKADLLKAYEALASRGIVKNKELETLKVWLQDLKTTEHE